MQRLVGLARHPGRIPAAIRRRVLPPTTPTAPAPKPEARPVPQELPPIAPRRYSELEIRQLGDGDLFDGHVLWAASKHETKPERLDLILIDPSPDDNVDDLRAATARLPEAPTVVAARTKSHLEAAERAGLPALIADLALAERTGEARSLLLPTVNPYRHNPQGWVRTPPEGLASVDPHGSHAPAQAKATHLTLDRAFRGSAHRFRGLYVDPRSFQGDHEYLAVVLRLAARGCPIVTPPNELIDGLIPYLPASTPAQIEDALERLGDDSQRERVSVEARRAVFLDHSPDARLEQILEFTGIRREPPQMISVLGATKRPDRIGDLVASFTSQAWPEKELILILHGADAFDLEAVDSALPNGSTTCHVVPVASDITLGEALNAGLRLARGAYIAKMDDDDHYGPQHLTDLMVAATYADASAVGKLANPTYLTESNSTVDWRIGDQEKHVHHLPGATMLIRRDLLDRYRFSRVEQSVDATLWRRMTADGHQLYSTHWLNFVRVRHGDNTYRRPEDDFIRLATQRPEPGLNPTRWFV